MSKIILFFQTTSFLSANVVKVRVTMGDLPALVDETIKSLGKYIKKPALNEKHLSKPPFRFLHDIVTEVR